MVYDAVMNNRQPKQADAKTPKNTQEKSKQTTIILAAVGGLAVLAVLIVAGIALFGGDGDTQPVAENTDGEQQSEETSEATTNNEESTVDDDADSGSDAATEMFEQSENDQTAETETTEPDQSFGPSKLFFGLAQGIRTDGAQVETEVEAPEDPAVVRQMMVEHLESQGLSEDDLADFFAAYDAVTGETVTAAVEALTEEEIIALEAAVTEASGPAFEGVISCLEPLLLAAFAAAADPELAEDPALLEAALEEDAQAAVSCLIDALNELGRQILTALEDNGLI